jgi:hypothetical protein
MGGGMSQTGNDGNTSNYVHGCIIQHISNNSFNIIPQRSGIFFSQDSNATVLAITGSVTWYYWVYVYAL